MKTEIQKLINTYEEEIKKGIEEKLLIINTSKHKMSQQVKEINLHRINFSATRLKSVISDLEKLLHQNLERID